MKNKLDWFENWFDTPWYHKLYCNRDESEAHDFVLKIMTDLNPKPDARILDLACGKGRHSKQINNLGYQVWGVDLSKKSIEEANKQASDSLRFAVHDMRDVFKAKHFDIILNLFTSFGYFNNREDNLRVMQSVCDGLKPNGIFVLDFLNANKVKSNLIPSETLEKEGLDFHIKRFIEHNVIVKQIQFTEGGKSHSYEERVTAFELNDLKQLFEPFKLNIEAIYGDYQLREFDPKHSDRLILVARKSNSM